MESSFDRHGAGSNDIPAPCYLPTPHCHNMVEDPSADLLRLQLNSALAKGASKEELAHDVLTAHLLHGLAYTMGSALGCVPPSYEGCLTAFLVSNSTGLTAGARAWTKHAHRSGSSAQIQTGWWGSPRGSVTTLNTRALALFDKVVSSATWKNLHWLPHRILVYEIRVAEGYGMRWSRDFNGTGLTDDTAGTIDGHSGTFCRDWSFRGFVEPMMDNGHEVGWRH